MFNTSTRKLKYLYEGGPKTPLEFIYKKLCIYFYIFKLQSP